MDEMNGENVNSLTSEELFRYDRHLILPEVGSEGQRKLKNARVLVIGAGGLGAPAAMYLAAAGVGHLGLVDFDVVESSNLQRQIIHGTSSVGQPKTASAKDRLFNINPNISIETHPTRLTSANAFAIIRNYDIVVDGTDNFPTRYLVNDACVMLGKPNVYGSVFRFEGQASVFGAQGGACYRCLYAEPPEPGVVPSCAEGGVLGVLPGIIGTIQANETIKLILGIGKPLSNRLLLFDSLQMQFRELKFGRDPKCPVCGEHPSITGLINYEQFCNPHENGGNLTDEITVIQLKSLLDLGQQVQLIDVRESFEYDFVHLPNSTLIPLGQISHRIHELDPVRTAIILCKSGSRSKRAINLMQQAGYTGVLVNLKGGIAAWSTDIDKNFPRY